MILKAICDRSDPRMFDLFRNRYNQEDLFVSYYIGSTMRNYYDGRMGRSRFWQMKANRTPEDEKGLVGGGEQTSRLTNFAEGKNDGQKKPEANLGNRITPLGV
jgi:hypothetical protein